MPELMAVYGNAPTIHLYLPHFQPGKKPRSPGYDAALCAVGVTPRPGRVHLPFTQAVKLEALPLPADDPRPGMHFPRRWCPVCLGRAIAEYHLTDMVIQALTEKITA